VRHAWSGADLGFESATRSVPSVGPLTPLPVQRPHPPIWVAAAMTPESFAWAGEQGFGLLVTPYAMGLENLAPLLDGYVKAHQRAGHPPETRRIQATFHLVLMDDGDAARTAIRAPLDRYMQKFAESVEVRPYSGSSYAVYAQVLKHVRALTSDVLLKLDRVIAGTPDEALTQLSRYLGMAPITDVTFLVDFGLLAREHVHRSIELLATKVAPSLRVWRR